jgi:peroxiredoxin
VHELDALQAVRSEIESLGASLVVLCPQLPEFTRPGAEKRALSFPILTDHGNKVGEAYGLTFRLPDDLIAVYKKLGVDLPKFNGDESWRLSIPARFVIGPDGMVAAAEADVDYTHRPEVEPTIDVLRTLRNGQA